MVLLPSAVSLTADLDPNRRGGLYEVQARVSSPGRRALLRRLCCRAAEARARGTARGDKARCARQGGGDDRRAHQAHGAAPAESRRESLGDRQEPARLLLDRGPRENQSWASAAE